MRAPPNRYQITQDLPQDQERLNSSVTIKHSFFDRCNLYTLFIYICMHMYIHKHIHRIIQYSI